MNGSALRGDPELPAASATYQQFVEFDDLRKLKITPVEFYAAYLEIKSLRDDGYYDEVLGDRDNSLIDYLIEKHGIENKSHTDKHFSKI